MALKYDNTPVKNVLLEGEFASTVKGHGSLSLPNAKANSLTSVTASGSVKRSLLPDGYTQYDYIMVNGECYYITDYYPTNKTELKTKTFVYKQPTSPVVCRWAGSPTNDTFGFYMGNVSGRMTFFFGRYSDSKYLNIESVTLNIEHDIYMGVNSIIFDGTSHSITRATFTSTQPLYIGAFNQSGTSLAGTMYGRIYPVEIIEEGATVRHYIPCKNANGVIGLYEAISGTFVEKSGTGVAKNGKPYIGFNTIPSTYTRLEFLQSTGTQYIDSGIIANFANNKIEQTAIVQYTTSTSNRELMGTNGYGFWGKNASNKIEAALGSTTTNENALNKNSILWRTDPDGKKLTLNVNKNQYTGTASSLVDANYAYYVFALGIRIGSGAAASFFCNAKVYEYAIAIDDEIVSYLIPCKRNADNVLGMYDVVTGTFKTNAGTGTFTAGGNIEPVSPSHPLPIVSNNGQLKAKHTSGLPLGYTKVEYIQSTGAQYINTGFTIPDLTNKYLVHLRMTVDGGSAQGTSSNNWGYMGINGGLMLTYTPNGLGLANEGVPVTANKIFDVTMTRNANASRSLVIDNTTFSMTNQQTAYADRPFGIFKLSPFGTVYNILYGKIYEFKAYINDVLVKNLIPCKRNTDNVLGMYDTISGDFLTNAGTGTFLAGNNVTDNIELYTEGLTETITDSANNTATTKMLLSIGDYTDTQEILTGAVTRKVGVIVLDGTEEWAYNPSGAFYCDDFTNVLLPNECICTHFVGVPTTVNIAGMPNNSIKTGSITITRLYVKTSDYADVQAFKTWLAQQCVKGTPVIIIYPLATQTTETVTGQTLNTVAGNNTLTITQASIENLPIEAQYIASGEVNYLVKDTTLVWANPKIYLEGPGTYTVVGSPTITNGVMTGFNASNYLKFDSITFAPGTGPFEFQLDYTTGASATDYGYSMCLPGMNVNQPGGVGKFRVNFRTTSENFYLETSRAANTNYVLKVTYDGNGTYSLYSNGVLAASKSSTELNTTADAWDYTIGIRENSATASINLNNTYVKAGNSVLIGKMHATQDIAPVYSGLTFGNITTTDTGVIDIPAQTFVADNTATWGKDQ